MTVKWTECKSLASIPEYYWDQVSAGDLDRNYQGTVIGTTKSFWGTTYLIVSCTDKKIREVEISKVIVINN